jgi:hypothetical protein
MRDELYKERDYDPCLFLSERECEYRYQYEYDSRGVYEVCKGQGGNDWWYLQSFTLTSTLTNSMLPHMDGGLTTEQIIISK